VRGLTTRRNAAAGTSTPMADYYPLISRAVGALEKNSGENRRAIYDRARAALRAQLRGGTPALDESDITRERLALEESIRKAEAESAPDFVEASRRMSAAKLRHSPMGRASQSAFDRARPAPSGRHRAASAARRHSAAAGCGRACRCAG